MVEQIIPKDAIGRELRIGDTIVYCMASDSQVYPSKRIICEIGMTTSYDEIVPYIKADDGSGNRKGLITNMNKVVLVSHAPIKGKLNNVHSDIVYME